MTKIKNISQLFPLFGARLNLGKIATLLLRVRVRVFYWLCHVTKKWLELKTGTTYHVKFVESVLHPVAWFGLTK